MNEWGFAVANGPKCFLVSTSCLHQHCWTFVWMCTCVCTHAWLCKCVCICTFCICVSGTCSYYLLYRQCDISSLKDKTTYLHDTLQFKSAFSRFHCEWTERHLCASLPPWIRARIVHDSSGKVGRSSQVSQCHFSLSANWGVFTSTTRAPDTLCVILEQHPQHSHRHCRIRFDHRHLKCKERTIHLSWD